MRNQTPLAPGGPASQMLARIVDPTETYRRRVERAERALENARSPEAKRLARIAVQRWRKLAELAQRQETEDEKASG